LKTHSLPKRSTTFLLPGVVEVFVEMKKKYIITYINSSVQLTYNVDDYMRVGDDIVFLDEKTNTRRKFPALFCIIEEEVKQ